VRNAIVQLPDQRTVTERRQAFRAAIRQLERAEVYLAAVAYIEPGDPAADRALIKLRADLAALHRHLARSRSAIRP
jgi:hypothetical protein